MAVSEGVINRRDNLVEWLKPALKVIPVSIYGEEDNVYIRFQELLICGVQVGEETYRIYNATDDWKEKTTCHCERADDGTWFYYVDDLDVCIGECKRLVMFEAKKSQPKRVGRPSSTNLSNRDRIFEIILPLFDGSKYTISKCNHGKYRDKIIEIVNNKTGNHDFHLWCHVTRVDFLVPLSRIKQIPERLGMEMKSSPKPNQKLNTQPATSFQNIDEDALIDILRFISEGTVI